MKQTAPFVVTISRQLGSGGAYIGQQLARKLNIYYADRDIISKATELLSAVESDVESRDEKILSFWQSFLRLCELAPDVYIPPTRRITPTDLDVFKAEAEIIECIVKERSAVVMGRCGFHILREHPNRVSIFLHGDRAFRNARIRKLYDVSDRDAGKMISQSDKERAVYVNTFTGKEWTDARNYDVSIDTGRLGVDKSVAFILKYLELL